MQLAMAPPSRNAKSFLKVEMVIRYTPNGFPYREPPTPKEKRTTSTGVEGAGRSLPFIAPPRSAAIPKKNRKRSRLGNRSGALHQSQGSGRRRRAASAAYRRQGPLALRLSRHQGRDLRHPFDLRHRLSDLSFGRGGALAATAAQANDYSLVIACYNSTISVESALDSYNRCLGSINGCSRQWRVLSWAQTTLIVSLSQQ